MCGCGLHTHIREHYQWNMDIWGVPGVEAEAELLSALVATLQSMGLTAEDVGIKVDRQTETDTHVTHFCTQTHTHVTLRHTHT